MACIQLLLFFFSIWMCEPTWSQVGSQLSVGARPAALGDAYVAMADDGYAAYWNPAGLASLRNQEINSMRANLYDTGFISHYLSYALPLNDRFGLAVDWLHAGFDDRELEFGQNRIGFSGGYRLASRLSLGFSAKWLNMNSGLVDLANPTGFSSEGAGWGFDLGLLCEPLPRFKVGLAVRDILDTQIEYENGVKRTVYPQQWRLAGAYKLSKSVWLSSALGEAAHLGAEFDLHPGLILRGGLQRDLDDAIGTAYSLGLGVRHSFTQVDYAFTQNPGLRATHRISLRLAFNFSASAVNIQDAQIENLFPAFYRSYAGLQPLGTVKLINKDRRPYTAKLSFFIPDLMNAPSEQQVILLPKTTRQVRIDTVLFPPRVAELVEPRLVQAEIKVAYTHRQRTRWHQKRTSLFVFSRNNIRWDDVRKAAAFITPGDPTVGNFARSVLAACEEEIEAIGKSGKNLMRAMVLFESLRQHGIHYTPDANNPYKQISADKVAVDDIQFPAELLEGRGGDCDDLTALYCALLENAGINTALVDFPGHIFMMFDTGLTYREAYKLPVDEKLYEQRGDRLWIPVEVTLFNQSFLDAWRVGAEQLDRLSDRERHQRVVDTAKAWRQYAPSNPQFKNSIEAPVKVAYREKLEQERAALKSIMDQYIYRVYLEKIRANPEDIGHRIRLASVYVAIRRWDRALDLYKGLLKSGSEPARFYNEIGNVYYLKGNIEQSEDYFRRALKSMPENEKIKNNINRIMLRRGGQESVPRAKKGDPTKAGILQMDEDKLYWLTR